MNNYKVPKDELFITGLILILVSFLLFCIPLMSLKSDDNGGLFLCNYLIAAAYFFVLILTKRLKRGRQGLIPLFFFLILFLISAYSLNREIPMFKSTVPWFAWLQIVLCANYIAFAFFDRIPAWAQYIMTFLLGVAIVTFAYIAIYLIPIYITSAIISFVLGISLHAFVGALFVIYTLVLLKKLVAGKQAHMVSFLGGAGLSVLTVIIYVAWWAMLTNDINTNYRHATVRENEGWPAWISMAQSTPHNGFTERILKVGLVYSAGEWNPDDFIWQTPERSFDEEKKHDPLVMIATLFSDRVNLSEDDRIKLLESMHDSRHQAQERLWSGDNLVTEHINTLVRIWPKFGISYTEKVITVSNMAFNGRWNGEQEEGIYTFHLPEGGVVTSLSLWIEDKEAKSILTTKQRADSAYKQIVGREQRDPSVLHWQEGNTISVRVFPVMAGESRKFKVGVTAPLTRENARMKYENIWFNGPSFSHAREEISLQFQQMPQDFISPAVFKPTGHWAFTRSGKYDPSWSIELADQPLSNEAFCFDGKQYNVRPYQKYSPAMLNAVYLDVNRSWTKDEFDSVCNILIGHKVYVFTNEMVQVDNNNKERVFDELHVLQGREVAFYLSKCSWRILAVSKYIPLC